VTGDAERLGDADDVAGEAEGLDTQVTLRRFEAARPRHDPPQLMDARKALRRPSRSATKPWKFASAQSLCSRRSTPMPAEEGEEGIGLAAGG